MSNDMASVIGCLPAGAVGMETLAYCSPYARVCVPRLTWLCLKEQTLIIITVLCLWLKHCVVCAGARGAVKCRYLSTLGSGSVWIGEYCSLDNASTAEHLFE